MSKEIKRKCQACNQIFNRNDLIKITKLANDVLKINPSSFELGRSMYLCKNKDCIVLAIKKKRIKNALKCSNGDEIKKIEEELFELFELK